MCGAAFATIAAALLTASIAAFVVAVVSAIQLSSRVRPGISRQSLVFRGILFYRRSTFDETAGPLHRRFNRSAGLFFALVLVTMAAGTAGAIGCR